MTTSVLTKAFPLLAIIFSILAYIYPALFADKKEWIVPLLGLVMFGMGTTLEYKNFQIILKKPKIILTGLLLQFTLMPVIAWGLAQIFNLDPLISAGLVLVGCCPGGTASNVICYLSKGHVALSIALTAFATLLSPLLTPWLTWIIVGKTVIVPIIPMFFSMLKIIIIPVVLGMLANRYLRSSLVHFKHFFPFLSVISIVYIIAIIIGLNQENIQMNSFPILIAVFLHNLGGLILGYIIPRFFKFEEDIARAISIEVGMQNSGLGTFLALQYFSKTAALPGALFSIWHNLSGSFLAYLWVNKPFGKDRMTS